MLSDDLYADKVWCKGRNIFYNDVATEKVYIIL